MGSVLETPVSNNKFYELFESEQGEYVDGHDIRPFLDWSPAHSDRPRWAKIDKQGRPITFRDSELKPVVDSEY